MLTEFIEYFERRSTSVYVLLLVPTPNGGITFLIVSMCFNGFRQGGVLSPQLFNVYIDGLSDILKTSTICGLLGGKLKHHLLYADDLCIVSVCSAGLQQLLSICDDMVMHIF